MSTNLTTQIDLSTFPSNYTYISSLQPLTNASQTYTEVTVQTTKDIVPSVDLSNIRLGGNISLLPPVVCVFILIIAVAVTSFEIRKRRKEKQDAKPADYYNKEQESHNEELNSAFTSRIDSYY